MVTEKCSVLLMYEGKPQPTLVGLTDDYDIKLAVARQLLKEAELGLRDAQAIGDPMLIARFSGKCQRLRTLLSLIVPGLEGGGHNG